MMNLGPGNGRIMAYDEFTMPWFDDTAKRIGTYFWWDDHWEWEPERPDSPSLYGEE